MAARVITLALTIITIGGCVIRGRGHNVALGTDAALVTAGIAILASQEKCETEPALHALNCNAENATNTLVAAPLIVGGVIALFTTLALNADKHEEPQKSDEARALMLGVRRSTVPPPEFTWQQVAEPDQGPCVAVVAAWRNEPDLARRSLLYRDMSAACRRFIIRPARAYTGPPGMAEQH